ncbi:MAG: hypothetical protein M3R09_05000 [Actinomycetota bacterium]|nr:hypothetical protein [Actinomycetota bacterium]
MRRGLMLEIWGYRSIWRFASRRPRVPRGAAPFGYHGPVMPLLTVLIVVSAIELVVVDVLVRRWPSVRITMLALGVWGLVWMFGLLFGFLTRPHAVGPDGIRVRSGAEVDIALDWDEIEAVVRHRRTTQDKQPQVSIDEHGNRTLHLRMQHETNIDLVLRRPVTVRLPRGCAAVSQIQLYADQPDGFVSAVGRHRVGQR